MGRKKEYRYFVGDFETSVYDGQTSTEVWASGCCELNTENAHIFTSIDEQFAYYESLNCDLIIYYHNLKFDGSFILDYLLVQRGLKQAYYKDNKENYHWYEDKEMPASSVKYSISYMGQWYQIVYLTSNRNRIVFQDSLKLLPFSVKEIGKSFKTKHQKLEIEYKGERHAFDNIKDEEIEYLKNDLYVPKEALELMHKEGHTKLTIGSCCLLEYKNICKISTKNELDYNEMFPDLSKFKIINFDEDNADQYIRKSYKGGWVYVVPEKAGKILHNGCTADVNSLYPSIMHSESGNYYPIGYPKFWKGDIPKQALEPDRYYFIRVECEFKIKEGYLPFVQIKDDLLYNSRECLTSSNVVDSKTKIEYRNRVQMTFTCTEYLLFLEHYNVIDLKIISGCWFYAMIGIFDEYIDKYKKQKMESTGARRELAKLFLNNLYGKLASNTDSSFKIAKIENNKLSFLTQIEHDKDAGYIAAGSAVTGYARNFTIRHAQKNYHGGDQPGFCYADTDSIHCDFSYNNLIDIAVHPTDFNHWKIETFWDKAIFVRPKTYIEHITHKDCKPVKKPFNLIKCAGMPDKCKELFNASLEGELPDNFNSLDEEAQSFLIDKEGNIIKRQYSDFKIGLSVPGKLRPLRIPGGIILVDTSFVIRR